MARKPARRRTATRKKAGARGKTKARARTGAASRSRKARRPRKATPKGEGADVRVLKNPFTGKPATLPVPKPLKPIHF